MPPEKLMKRPGSKKPRKDRPVELRSHRDIPFCAMSLASTRANKTGKWRTIKPIVLNEKCVSCAMCWKFCPEPCIKMENGLPVIDYDYCKGCGICIEVCPVKAIVFAEEEK